MVCTITGAIGGTIAYFFGGWDQALVTLIIFMAIDYISGLIVAGVFHNSKKTAIRNTGKPDRLERSVQEMHDAAVCSGSVPAGSGNRCGLHQECCDHRIYGERADQYRRECRTDGHTAAGSDRQCDRHTDTESR